MQDLTQTNRAYTGLQICHKSKQCFYKGEKRQKVEKTEWIYTEHAYPVIIPEALFEKVQEVRLKNRIH